jgi:ribosome recycling factor
MINIGINLQNIVMELETTLEKVEKNCKNIVDKFQEEIKNLGLGGSNVDLIRNIIVKTPGGNRRIISLASVGPGSGGEVVITPYERSNSSAICSAINGIGIGTATGGSGKIFFKPQKISLEIVEKKLNLVKSICNKKKADLRMQRQNWVKKHSKNKKSLGEDNYNTAMKKLEKIINNNSAEIDNKVSKFTNNIRKFYGYKS